MNTLTGRLGTRVFRMTDTPEVPPNAKWLGVLNTTMAMAVRMSPALSSRKNRGKLGAALRLRETSSLRRASSGVWKRAAPRSRSAR